VYLAMRGPCRSNALARGVAVRDRRAATQRRELQKTTATLPPPSDVGGLPHSVLAVELSSRLPRGRVEVGRGGLAGRQ
jgi:hypothetical protein